MTATCASVGESDRCEVQGNNEALGEVSMCS
jgi:hypothetical protein